MIAEIIKIKQAVFKILMVSVVFFFINAVVFLLLVLSPLLIWSDTKRVHLTIEITVSVFFAILAILCLFAIIGGVVFLVKNKKTSEIKKIKARSALAAGIFYFKIADRIEKLIDERIDSEKHVEVVNETTEDVKSEDL